MDLLIASAPHADTFGYSMPPPGLLRLGGEFVRQDRPIRLDDLAFRLARGDIAGGDRLADSATEWLLREGQPDVLGLSTMGATLPIALAIAERVKRVAPEIKVLIGGPGAGGIDRELLERFPAIDCVVRGEAEHTLPELIDRIEQNAELDVAGVTWRTRAGAIQREPDPERSVDSSFPEDGNPENDTATVSFEAIQSPCSEPGTLCNIFSPNGDGVNDTLIFIDPNNEFPNNRLEVFDRYGNSVFAADGYDGSWDGTGSNGELPLGTYFYVLDLGNGTEPQRGWIQIIR